MIEIVVSVAVVVVIVASALGAGITATHHFGPDPIQVALEASVANEMRVAVDIVKYGGTTIHPNAVATTLPFTTPLPAELSVSTESLADGSIAITITGSTQQPTRTASLTATVAQRAPPAGSQIVAPGTAPAPTGAP